MWRGRRFRRRAALTRAAVDSDRHVEGGWGNKGRMQRKAAQTAAGADGSSDCAGSHYGAQAAATAANGTSEGPGRERGRERATAAFSGGYVTARGSETASWPTAPGESAAELAKGFPGAEVREHRHQSHGRYVAEPDAGWLRGWTSRHHWPRLALPCIAAWAGELAKEHTSGATSSSSCYATLPPRTGSIQEIETAQRSRVASSVPSQTLDGPMTSPELKRPTTQPTAATIALYIPSSVRYKGSKCFSATARAGPPQPQRRRRHAGAAEVGTSIPLAPRRELVLPELVLPELLLPDPLNLRLSSRGFSS
ncbi:hypothetical protein CDD81_6164 [Ophiocordyceps australis]|uniref:Uncharacterized protein n=1 Tax=Ophiocordyceps australis TaxID=1399860 RepID=A0A2C5Y7I1_9HYPO|nr:hypothetical protein CDD81_6164 [Ophiocordyceps australis]